MNTNFRAEEYEYRCRKELPVRLRKLRLAKGTSREALSELCNTHSDAIRRYESGIAMPRCETLIEIADYFNVRLDYLVGRNETK